MKKTTLFTTLALVVIVAIALSTATFAWYSSVSSVDTDVVSVEAASAGADIEILEQPSAITDPLKNAILDSTATATGIETSDLICFDGGSQSAGVARSTSFKIQNNSVTNPATVSVTVTISDVKKADDTANGTTKIQIAIKKSTDTTYTLISDGAIQGESATANGSLSKVTFTVEIAASDNVQIDAIIWINGIEQINTLAGTTANIKFVCSAVEKDN